MTDLIVVPEMNEWCRLKSLVLDSVSSSIAHTSVTSSNSSSSQTGCLIEKRRARSFGCTWGKFDIGFWCFGNREVAIPASRPSCEELSDADHPGAGQILEL
jgi:hypothetical protein